MSTLMLVYGWPRYVTANSILGRERDLRRPRARARTPAHTSPARRPTAEGRSVVSDPPSPRIHARGCRAPAFRPGPTQLAFQTISLDDRKDTRPSSVGVRLAHEIVPKVAGVRVTNGPGCCRDGHTFNALDIARREIRVVDDQPFGHLTGDANGGRQHRTASREWPSRDTGNRVKRYTARDARSMSRCHPSPSRRFPGALLTCGLGPWCAQRQHPDACPALVNRQKRTALDVFAVHFECPYDDTHRSF